jgi:membrane protein implicated in regulation of membrane protease activity
VADDDAVVGRVGPLVVATRGAEGPGEVLIKIRGGSEAYRAWSDEPLPKGSSVLVVNARGLRAVDVVLWNDGTTPSGQIY